MALRCAFVPEIILAFKAHTDLLQQDLNSLLNCCGSWLLSLNFAKCKNMSIGPKSTFSQYYAYFHLDDGAHQICAVPEEKDLDVIFDEHLHFYTHILDK